MISELKQQAPAEHQVQRLCQILEVSRAWYYQRPRAVAAQQTRLEKLASEIEAVLTTKAGRGYDTLCAGTRPGKAEFGTCGSQGGGQSGLSRNAPQRMAVPPSP